MLCLCSDTIRKTATKRCMGVAVKVGSNNPPVIQRVKR